MSRPAPPQPSNALRIVGYASLFGVKDLAGDVVAKGAFARSLERRPARDIAMLHQHGPDAAIGRWDVVAEDAKGLFVVGRILPVAPTGAYAAALVRAGVLEIDLIEISLVAFPMLPAARLRPVDAAQAFQPAA